MAVSSAQESETPSLLRTLGLLYIAKIFASVYYGEILI